MSAGAEFGVRHTRPADVRDEIVAFSSEDLGPTGSLRGAVLDVRSNRFYM